jgi:hypothetical protein
MVSKQTTQRRRRNSKRQKRRSLKRRNVKSRKVMRGGVNGDPLEGIKVNQLVSIDLVINTAKKIDREYPQGSTNISAICRVLSVSEASGDTKKTVKLRITNEEYKFCNSYVSNENGRGQTMDEKDPLNTHCSDEFEILYDPTSVGYYPYYFKNIVKNADGTTTVSNLITYTYVKPRERNIDLYDAYKISKVVPVGVTASQ